jgi:hypothetical protein
LGDYGHQSLRLEMANDRSDATEFASVAIKEGLSMFAD